MTLKLLIRSWIKCDECGREDEAARRAQIVSGPEAIESALAQKWKPKDRPIEPKGRLLFTNIEWICERCQGIYPNRVDTEKEEWLKEQYIRTKDLPRPRCQTCTHFTPPPYPNGDGTCAVLFVADSNSTTLAPGSVGHGGYFHIPARVGRSFGCVHHVEKEST